MRACRRLPKADLSAQRRSAPDHCEDCNPCQKQGGEGGGGAHLVEQDIHDPIEPYKASAELTAVTRTNVRAPKPRGSYIANRLVFRSSLLRRPSRDLTAFRCLSGPGSSEFMILAPRTALDKIPGIGIFAPTGVLFGAWTGGRAFRILRQRGSHGGPSLGDLPGGPSGASGRGQSSGSRRAQARITRRREL